MCVCVCVSLVSDSPRKLLKSITIVKPSTVTASDMIMHHVLIILTLTFIQGHTCLNPENTNCHSLIISETFQVMPITFAAKIDRQKVYMIIASPMTLTFIHGHKCVSNLTTF